jgi:hypothetical protein
MMNVKRAVSQNPFAKDSRAKRLYDTLKKDCENKNLESLVDNSLPRFYRMVVLEPNHWHEIINLYDLFVHLSINKVITLQKLESSIEFCNDLKSGEAIGIKEQDFRQLVIVKIADQPFTVNQFLRSISYHGALHSKPNENNEDLAILYDKFIEPFYEQATQLALQIAQILLDGYANIMDKINGDPNAYGFLGYQPIIYSGADRDVIRFSDTQEVIAHLY